MTSPGGGSETPDWHRFGRWLESAMPDMGSAEVLRASRPSQGYSATTWDLDIGWSGQHGSTSRLVLRLEPTSPGLFFGVDFSTPFRVMQDLAGSGVPVPGVVGIERGPDVLGAPFYVMAHCEGRVLIDVPSYHQTGWFSELAPAARWQVWMNGLDAMASVHAVNAEPFGYLDQPAYGRPGLSQYVAWVHDWYRWVSGGQAHDLLNLPMSVLADRQPNAGSLGLVWGDARPGNILFDDRLEVGAVLDWEMVTLGPGEIDLGWWLFCDRFYCEHLNVERLGGLPDRETQVERYESRLGRPVQDLEYYELLAAVRMAIIQLRAATRWAEPGQLVDLPSTTTASRIAQELAHRLQGRRSTPEDSAPTHRSVESKENAHGRT